MKRLLFIEQSSTLRHILNKSLSKNGYIIESVSDFDEALLCLGAASARRYDGIVVGWPPHNNASSDELLAALELPPYHQTAVLVIADSPDAAKLNWVTNRQRSALLLWENHNDAAISMQKLLAPESLSSELVEDPPHTISILLVDDSPTARVKFRKILQNVGYQVDTATSADEALDKVQSRRFDIAVLDYFMPDVTGDQLCRELREQPHTGHILTAILTSTYHDKVISDSLAAGAVEVMFKNEAEELLLARVAAMSRTVSHTRRIEQDRLYLSGILSSVGDGVYGVDQDCEITFANPAALNMLGYGDNTPLIGKQPAELFHCASSSQEDTREGSPGQPVDYMEKAIRHGIEQHSVETVFQRIDGTLLQVELTIFPLRIKGKKDGAVVAFRDVSVRKLLEEELKWQANHDQLTQLLNRKYLEDALDKEVLRLQRSKETSALLYIDLDRFKYINDTIGHAAGDQLLIEISRQLQKRLRKSDLLARLGGDEFAVLMHNIDRSHLFDAAENFRQLLEDLTFNYDKRIYKVNGSIGVSLIDQSSLSAGDVLSSADIACHIAKGKGRNQTHLYSNEEDDRAAMDLELGWSTRLRQALDDDLFELYFQPIVPLDAVDVSRLRESDGALWSQLESQNIAIHHEVLLRLPNTQGEMILPNAYLPTAERFNMMSEIDCWVIRKALQTLAEFDSEKLSGLAINISGQSMDSECLLPLIKEEIERWDLKPEMLLFEITESSAINHAGSAYRLITELNQLGCRFALDDFGTGYSSFSHLKHLPVDFIKIDGQFVKDIIHDPMDYAIVTSINNVAHSLGKLTVAEYVEDVETLEMLKEAGVDYIQGFYVSQPVAWLPASAPTKKTAG